MGLEHTIKQNRFSKGPREDRTTVVFSADLIRSQEVLSSRWTKEAVELHYREPQVILLLGSGGRECAMARSIAMSHRCDRLYIAPGNAGTDLYGINVPELSPKDFEAVARFALDNQITLLVVGPEEPLVMGIADYFSSHSELDHIAVVGPGKSGARLEGSKDFSKAFMQRHQIPTARYRSFTASEEQDAYAFIDFLSAPYVLKVDGLAAGKGVEILDSAEEAKVCLRAMLQGKFGEAGNTVLIEEYLHGIECSVFVAIDGQDYRLLPVAKDYKRIGDGDMGPNTGGMGSVSPVPFADKAFMQKVEDRIVRPTIEGLVADGILYKGFLFVGLMNVGGDPFVIEYNCRLGDPEAESVLPRVKSDFVDLLLAIAFGRLAEYQLGIDDRAVVSVMLVSGGYPNNYTKGMVMDLPDPPEDIMLFHAGTRRVDDQILTDGGRVLAVSAFGETIEAALEKSYCVAKQVLFEGKNYRHDIGQDLL
ncbi:MAG: phosphoribosylamine--glycine ligase [Porphyromonas sp.]|nr:phosphoribosylamine--glycine ligase [Porphyromonas sp.]